ncbi:MAG: transporter substrate-binding domain-containing protein [Rhodospirillales bacterium]
MPRIMHPKIPQADPGWTYLRHAMTCVVVVCAILFGSPVRAESYRIFGDDSEPPKSSLSVNGRPEGRIVEVVRFVAKESGIDFNIELYPWARAYKLAADGEGLVMSLSWTAERAEIFDYTDPIFYDDVVVVTHEDRIATFETIDHLRGKTLAMNIGSSYGEAFDLAIEEGLFRVQRVANRVNWYRMLMNGRVDGVVAAQGVTGVDAVLRMDPELWERRNEFRVFAKPLKRDPNYIGIPKSLSSPELLARLNGAIAAYWAQSGETREP